MARIELAPEISGDFERTLAHLERHQADRPTDRVREIIAAITVLETNPLIGRPAANNNRELLIGRDAHGYVALYHYVATIDVVFVLAIRAQREAGYARP